MPTAPLKRRDSNMSNKSWRSMFSTPGDKGEDRKTNQILVYDPLNKRLWHEDRDDFVKGQKTYVRVPIPGSELKVNVFRELPRQRDAVSVPASPRHEDGGDSRRTSVVGAHRETAKLLIATVNLERLGSFAKKQRKKRNMQHIYVIGSNPMGFGSVQEEDGDGDGD
ncbi:hypothetical protein EG328_007420 [Venturia inaequalis]|uniref:Uncharacterized protein n=1 Tax=Venturia inaequalis TaxID=5025 RepID=A0A8H3ZEM9_VENIN|nr:hypothetical protein EG328_007420 [Venturia inaequalis]KAE9993428.1 hypothetical protein EG327_005199 [Venturia inaequalis]